MAFYSKSNLIIKGWIIITVISHFIPIPNLQAVGTDKIEISTVGEGCTPRTFEELGDLLAFGMVESRALRALLELKIARVSLPGGTFMMGSEDLEENRNVDEIPHQISLSPFKVMDTHLTRGQLLDLGIASDPSNCNGITKVEVAEWNLTKNLNKPATCLSWNDVAQKVIPALRMRGINARFLTEAEAEYLSRLSGSERNITVTPYPWGTDESRLSSFVWSASNSRAGVHDVKTTPKNPTPNLYDVQGNVSTWVKDFYGDYPKKACVNPEGAKQGVTRVYRGGSYKDRGPQHFRSAVRRSELPYQRVPEIGIRLVIG